MGTRDETQVPPRCLELLAQSEKLLRDVRLNTPPDYMTREGGYSEVTGRLAEADSLWNDAEKLALAVMDPRHTGKFYRAMADWNFLRDSVGEDHMYGRLPRSPNDPHGLPESDPWLLAQRKAHENRVRRRAKDRGVRLRKSRRRDTGALDYGRFWLIDPWNSNAVLYGGEWGATLDDIEQRLSEPHDEFAEQEARQMEHEQAEWHRRAQLRAESATS